MNASKENARKALEALERRTRNDSPTMTNSYPLDFVKEFLEAALRKLPTETAFRAKTKTTGS